MVIWLFSKVVIQYHHVREPDLGGTGPGEQRIPNGLQTNSERSLNGLRTNPERSPNGPRTDPERTRTRSIYFDVEAPSY